MAKFLKKIMWDRQKKMLTGKLSTWLIHNTFKFTLQTLIWFIQHQCGKTTAHLISSWGLEHLRMLWKLSTSQYMVTSLNSRILENQTCSISNLSRTRSKMSMVKASRPFIWLVIICAQTSLELIPSTRTLRSIGCPSLSRLACTKVSKM